jgi:hypothetical protein
MGYCTSLQWLRQVYNHDIHTVSPGNPMLPQAHKGRGATSRIAGRFEKTRIDLSGEETHERAAQEPPTELRARPFDKSLPGL